MTQATPTSGTGFRAYEYTTIRVPRDLESIYADSYRNFGWITEATETGLPGATTVTLRLKRDRALKNRPLVAELQRQADVALVAIAALERSASTAALGLSIGVGIVGTAFLAGSVFSLEAGLVPLSIVLGAVGLVGWLAGYLVHGRVLAQRTARVIPLVDAQYDVVYQSGERASHLLAA
ncbi:hypothetical protein [Cryobacterium sp. W22_MBD10_FK3]|uniref:hypothetical protein n=1 Tax=Cryobacterium sp. W22_MBD10_FK3 TaxID=3240273 RepID=UPI003F905737